MRRVLFCVIDNSRQAVYGYDQRVEVFGSQGNVAVKNDFPDSAELSTAQGVFSAKPQYFFLERYKMSYVEKPLLMRSPMIENPR
jgi:myo-inositol 2-dehydrogenase/D-chiro-inositol 1-dehydrogenase